MTDEQAVLQADQQFDAAVVKGDVDVLERLLADDFILIDLMGAKSMKAEFIEVMKAGELQFEILEAEDVHIRLYDATAVVTGRTHMSVRRGELSFDGNSRFTHVYLNHSGQWRMVSAQGTQIP